MSLTLYDAALLHKFRSVFPNTYIATSETVIQMMSEQGEAVKLPVMNLYNMNYEVAGQLYNFPELRSGRPMSYVDTKTKEEIANILSLPIRIDYQVDLADNSRERINGIMKEIMFWLYRNPLIEIAEPTTGTKFTFTTQIEGGVQDNSDIMSFADRGRIYRNTLTLVIPDARFFMHRKGKTVLEVLVDEHFGEDFDPDSFVSQKRYVAEDEQ